MYHEDAEMLFPMRVVPSLGDLRGSPWKRLVHRVAKLEEDDPDALAFGLMMIRIVGCLNCQADSFRALRGCTACARQAILRFRGNDQDLLRLFDKSKKEIRAYLENGPNSKEGR
ncbi:MAG: hypothetical protein JW929_07820 [Anaerolineales bacterium]|nr:hypothetical protein [Anaerolineales bacterium]